MPSSAALDMVAINGSSPYAQGSKVNIAALHAALQTMKPFTKSDNDVGNQVVMAEYRQALRLILTANGFTDTEFDIEHILRFHKQVRDKAFELPQLDAAIAAEKTIIIRQNKMYEILLRDQCTAMLKSGATAREKAELEELLNKIDVRLQEIDAKIHVHTDEIKLLQYQGQAFKVHLASLMNLSEINECMMYHLSKSIPVHLRDLVLKHVDPNYGSMSLGGNHSLGSQFCVPVPRIVPLDADGQPLPEPDIWTVAAITKHKVLEAPAEKLTQWLRFLNHWESKHGITSVMQVIDFKKNISVVNEDNRFMVNYKLEDWHIKSFLARLNMLSSTNYAFLPMDEMVLFINMVNHDDHPRFKQLITTALLDIDRPGFQPTAATLQEMYRSFIAADNAHWLQSKTTPTPLEVNVAWKTKGNQGSKMAAHGGKKQQKRGKQGKKPFYCRWCCKKNHHEHQCNSKKDGKPQKFVKCFKCQGNHYQSDCPLLVQEDAEVLASITTNKQKATTQETSANKKKKVKATVVLPTDDQVEVDMVEILDSLQALTVVNSSEEVIIDSGSMTHCLLHKPAEGFREHVVTPLPTLKFGNGQELVSTAVGSIGSAVLRNTVICAGLSKNLLSVSQLSAAGVTTVTTAQGCYLIKGKVNFKGTDVLTFAPVSNGLYKLPLGTAFEMLGNL